MFNYGMMWLVINFEWGFCGCGFGPEIVSLRIGFICSVNR